ncbi:MAG TPA: hypothetical protein VH436_03745 [Vicinamibacterales bacterium]|jgi:hypothetical protein
MARSTLATGSTGPPKVDRDSAPREAWQGSERREPLARAALLERFRQEFRTMSGLWVTRAEARRLFGVREDICERVLDRLVADGMLIRSAGGVYRRPPPFSAPLR